MCQSDPQAGPAPAAACCAKIDVSDKANPVRYTPDERLCGMDADKLLAMARRGTVDDKFRQDGRNELTFRDTANAEGYSLSPEEVAYVEGYLRATESLSDAELVTLLGQAAPGPAG